VRRLRTTLAGRSLAGHTALAAPSNRKFESKTNVYRRLLFCLCLALLFVPHTAVAAPRDNSANQKIDEAINKYYLATDFDKAEAILKGILEACEDRCSPGIKAKAWMYIGIVRGSGRQDLPGAQESFQQAFALDPKVKLDDALATPQTQTAFAQAAAAIGGGTPKTSGGDTGGGGGDTAPKGEAAGNMECTPAVEEVEQQRAIPIACTTEEAGASKVTLRYKAFGGADWVQLAMTKKGDYWQAEIPCSETGVVGALKYYVQAKDKEGEQVDAHGTKKAPIEIKVVAHTDAEPPSYPGESAPAKCMDAASCPPDMVGTPACPTGGKGGRGGKGWGTPCDQSEECQSGLLCMQGDSGRTCETAPSCTSTVDCPAGAECVGGKCDIGEGGGGASGPYKKNWLGLHVGADLAFLSGDRICDATSSFYCYYGDGKSVPSQNLSDRYKGNVKGGTGIGTIRVMASFERLIMPNIGAEARVGFAFNGGPSDGDQKKFMPFHVEVRGKYWFIKDGFMKPGFRPYVHVGGGMAEVDAKITVQVVDCTDAAAPATCVSDPRAPGGTPRHVDAYRKLGLGFITFGGGFMYAISKNSGPVLNLNFLYLLGDPTSSGFVIEPSLGYQFGL